MTAATRIRHGDPIADALLLRETGEPNTYEVDSESAPGRTYRVTVNEELDSYACKCRSSTGKCWHGPAALVWAKAERRLYPEKERTQMTSPTQAVAIRDRLDPEESTALVPVQVRPPQALLPTRDEILTMNELAKAIGQEGVAGMAVPAAINSPAKAFVVMLAGWELGIRPMVAFRHVFVVNGRTEPDSQLMMGIVLARDPSARFEFLERSHQRCLVKLSREGRADVLSEYSVEDAVKSGQMKTERSYWDKQKNQRVTVKVTDSPWLLYTRDMLAWAAVKRAVRLGSPDCVNAIEAVGDSGALGESLYASAVEEERPAEMQAAAAIKQLAREAYSQPDTHDEAPPFNRETGEILDEEPPSEAWHNGEDLEHAVPGESGEEEPTPGGSTTSPAAASTPEPDIPAEFTDLPPSAIKRDIDGDWAWLGAKQTGAALSNKDLARFLPGGRYTALAFQEALGVTGETREAWFERVVAELTAPAAGR